MIHLNCNKQMLSKSTQNLKRIQFKFTDKKNELKFCFRLSFSAEWLIRLLLILADQH